MSRAGIVSVTTSSTSALVSPFASTIASQAVASLYHVAANWLRSAPAPEPPRATGFADLTAADAVPWVNARGKVLSLSSGTAVQRGVPVPECESISGRSASLSVHRATLADHETMFRIHVDAVTGRCETYYLRKQIEGWFVGRSLADYTKAIERGADWIACHDG